MARTDAPLRRALKTRKKPRSATVGRFADPPAVASTARPARREREHSRTAAVVLHFPELLRTNDPWALPTLLRPCASPQYPGAAWTPAIVRPCRGAGLAHLLVIFREELLTSESATPSKKRGGGRDLNLDRAMVLLKQPRPIPSSTGMVPYRHNYILYARVDSKGFFDAGPSVS